MKHLFTLILLTLGYFAIGQCPTNITFTTQQQIDDFPSDYPGCTDIPGSVAIGNTGTSGTDITNVDGLSSIESIGAELSIFSNHSLTNLDGFSSLTSIGGYLYITDNTSLPDLDGFSSLTSIGGYFYLYGNSVLTNVDGFSSVSSIGGYFYVALNGALTNVDGFSSLTSINQWISIYTNVSLTNLDGLSSLTSMGGSLSLSGNQDLSDIHGVANIDANTITDLTIKNNTQLSVCNEQSICDYLDMSGSTTTINNNDSGCNSRTEVEDACNTPPPPCTNLTDPLDGSTDVNIITDLSWNSSTDATGYKLTVGTTSGGTDIEDNTDVGNVTTYDPGDFPCGSTIYVTITPYNDTGDATGCTEESFTTEDVAADAGADTEFCEGGSVQLNASGGTTYSWSPTDGLDDPTIANPIANPAITTTYTVTVSNDGRCPDTDDVLVTVNPHPVPNATATDETANDANDGTATASPSGGTSPYSYEWSNGETTQTVEDLTPGDYTVTVTDDNSCTAEETVTVYEFICPTLTLESTQTDASCFEECDGEITITNVVNGVAPFTYSWSNGQTTQTATDLCAGDYSVTVTDDKNCSVVSETFTISEPEAIIVNASSTNETANDANDGTATANPTNGNSPYTYSWSNGENTQTIDNLSPGTYTVTVTDDNGCINSESVDVEEFTCPTLTVQYEQLNPTCNGYCNGSIEVLDVINGVEPFTYLWSTGGTDANILDLCTGTYNVTITDADNCSVVQNFDVVDPDILFANASSTNETGNGAQDGTAFANPTGGTSPYNYAWNTGATTQSISNLAPGDYMVTVTDDNDCTRTDTVTVNEFSCPTLTVNTNQTNVNCFGACTGEIEVTSVTNAVEPLSYDWSNGETTALISNLCQGSYTVTITDAKNCQVIQDYIITQPQELFTNASTTDETTNDANDGTATANPTGGISPYSYAWSNGESTQTISGLAPGSYTVTVTDANGCTSIESVSVAEFGCQGLAIAINQTNVKCNSECNGILDITGVTNGATPFTYTWSNGKTMAKIDSLCPGSYSVTVVDGNNCNVYGSYTITEPQPLSANATSTDETAKDANDGTAISNPSGGTLSYAYNWSTSDTTQVISGLSPGSYFLTVSDANGCTALDTVTIIEFTCPNLEVNSQTSNISCFGACDGSIAVLSVNNAISPLSYNWSTGATSASLSNLCVGDYSVTITDAKNCEVVQNYTLTQPDKITITIDSTRNVRLDPLGYIAITTNNNGNYIFSWTGPSNFTAKTEDLDSLNDFGCYTLMVTDTTTNCSIDSTICLEDKTATYNLKLGNINIYPNPAKGDFILDFSNTKLTDAEITIFDLSGKQQLNLEKKTSDRVLKVKAKILNAGLYIIRIKSPENRVTYRKIVLSK